METGCRSAELGAPSVTNTGTLFSTLSTDEISVIVTQLQFLMSQYRKMVKSKRVPDKPNTFKQVLFLALLFSENSPFRTAAASLVSEIELDSSHDQFDIDSYSSRLIIRPQVFEGEGKEMELGRIVFSVCGPKRAQDNFERSS